MTTEEATTARARPEPIKAVPVRHPGRWVAVAVLSVLAAMFVHLLVTNEAFNWSFMVDKMFRPPIIEGLLRGTVLMTVSAMLIGVTLGVVIAVMRLSDNPILRGVAWLYTWFFRAVPRLVLLAVFGNIGILWSRVEFGVPFDTQIGQLFGIDNLQLRLFGFSSRDILTGFMAGLLGLALSEAAYMAEIVRAGIQSVDPGQTEAAQALGLSRAQLLRRVVLPQAMRVIIPPTGNETIAMLKDTSLLLYVPVSVELFFQLDAVGKRTFQIFPMYVAACLWYLFLTSILLVGQYYLERHFGKGYGVTGRARLKLRGMTAEAGGGAGVVK
ncbi:amino acid ABC transporter permease [Micromonospora aurantiaca]|uniref:Amino acid ABC transporter permease n=1 Tax=Micromonospora aurantiaca (nom. illeg.) TaxID=47850 RepID=A0A6N3KAK6_9ACTN|nr:MULTISPECIES: amino acid ABC transporter permease [Micromonospora]ADL47898.1 polar amino acid ABC transporter, inner membrane subunit [Micromonospora aurantiaca ATCC 27029]ADU09430.1 polar amino acid ABC transporter, inner membrane subunit [Micromonospora sp. L5]AXH93963.1 amino acid ABC transporter permease [Micromonospora aurantiaca]MBF5031401.1 amino acid ABC transporter permease [Micromonospora sp. ANENR4]MCO1614988.1 amino acid ABC transporter permease [Micromonospora sp. CPM1]